MHSHLYCLHSQLKALLMQMFCFCRKNTHLQYWSAVLGLHAQSSMNSQEVQIRQVDRIIINKNYNRRTKEADIAMMHLQQPVNFTGQWQRAQDKHSAQSSVMWL